MRRVHRTARRFRKSASDRVSAQGWPEERETLGAVRGDPQRLNQELAAVPRIDTGNIARWLLSQDTSARFVSLEVSSNAEGVPQKAGDEDENNNTRWNNDWRYEPSNHDQPPVLRIRSGDPS
jgi:hypothetical protein